MALISDGRRVARDQSQHDHLTLGAGNTDTVGGWMTTAVPPIGGNACPMPMDLGETSGASDCIYDDAPYALVRVWHHSRGDSYWVYTSEHTDADALADVWAVLPRGLESRGSEAVVRAPAEFEATATRVTVTYLATRKGIAVGITKEEFFTAQGLL